LVGGPWLVKMLQEDWLIVNDYLLFHVWLKNSSLIWWRHHCRWRARQRAANLDSGPLSRKGSLSCHTCCDTGFRFLWSNPKVRPTQSPLTICKGMQMTYEFSNPVPHEWLQEEIYLPVFKVQLWWLKRK
jgi:hypothetical protein